MRPPACSTMATVSLASSTFTSQPTTHAPSAAKRTAAARPCPLAVPVMSATLPSSRPGMAVLPALRGRLEELVAVPVGARHGRDERRDEQRAGLPRVVDRLAEPREVRVPGL